MNRRLVAVATLVVSLLAFPGIAERNGQVLLAQPGDAVRTAPGNAFDGIWWVTIVPGRPMILKLTRSGPLGLSETLDNSGTFVLEDSLDWGGFTNSSFSQTQGTWQRLDSDSARALGLRFVVQPDGKIRAAERVRLVMHFSRDLRHLEGELTLAALFCETVPTPPGVPFPEIPSCPDPTSEPADVLRGPLPFSAVRLTNDAPSP